MKYTIVDVAKEAGVSITTVSRVINGNYPVKIETKEKVNTAIKKLEFTPNPLAKGLINKKTNTIGILVPSISNLFFTEVVCGIEKISSLYEYDVILSETNGSAKAEKLKIEKFVNRMVDGMIIVDPHIENTKNGFIEKISKELPIVCINGYSKNVNSNFVLSDEGNGTIEAFEYLLNLGHKKIAFIRGGESYSYDLKEHIYRKYMKNIREKEIIIDINEGNNIEVIERTESKILELKEENYSFPEHISAFFACNDLMAVGVLNGLKKIGIKVPEQISIIGCDNTLLSQMATPKITTIDQHMRTLGFKAAEGLFKILNKTSEKKILEIIPTNLIKRESCSEIF